VVFFYNFINFFISKYPPIFIFIAIYRVIKESLCIWWLQYKKHAHIF
jgi:hypothetical protein